MKYPWKLLVEWISDGEFVAREILKVYSHGKTSFQEYLIAEVAGLGKVLVLDGKVQSSISDEYWYHEALVHPVMLAHPCPRRVLIVGGGEGATAREVLKHSCVERVVMVDIDSELIEAVRKFMPEMSMGSFENSKLQLVIADGRKYIESTGEKYDVVILDLVDPTEGGPAAKLYTLEFYKAVKSILATPGIMVTQATSPILTPKTFAVIRNTIAKVFRIARPYITYVRSYNGIWGFVAGSDTLDPATMSEEQVEKLLAERIKGTLRFYDGQTHKWMFTLPKPLREYMEKIEDYATDENPVYVPV